MKGLQRIITNIIKADNDYGMIENGDVIAVGVSGGKDSLALLCALYELKRFYNKSFSVIAIMIDLRFENINRKQFDYKGINELCSRFGFEFHIVDSDIAEVVFNVRKEENPCSLCANMRRGILCSTAVSLGANKLALGHHFDDVVQTFMLNLFYEGRIGVFSPKTILEKKDLTIIRPLIYTQEKDILYFTRSVDLPIINQDCPANKNTKREDMKTLLVNLEKENKGLRHRIFKAIQKNNVDGFGVNSKEEYKSEF